MPAKPVVVTADVRVYAARAVYPHDLLRRASDCRHQFRQKFVLESQERFYGFDDGRNRGRADCCGILTDRRAPVNCLRLDSGRRQIGESQSGRFSIGRRYPTVSGGF